MHGCAVQVQTAAVNMLNMALIQPDLKVRFDPLALALALASPTATTDGSAQQDREHCQGPLVV